MDSMKKSVEGLFEHPSSGEYVGIIRLEMVREHGSLYGGRKMSDARNAAEIVRPLFARADREMMAVMSVSSSLEPLAVEVAAVGGLDTCHVDIRNIFKHAILNNAGNIICFHNHPGGTPLPGVEDKRVTQRIREAGKLLNIKLLDHIILCDSCYYSFSREGTFCYE